jgi:predicted GTPase
LAGNKTDLSKSVDESAVKAFADRHKIQPFEMSAKTGDNVAQLFQAVVTTVTGMEIGKSETISVEAVPAEPAAGKSCC